LLESFLPSLTGTILITTRYQWTKARAHGDSHELSPFNEVQSIQLFSKLWAVYDSTASPSTGEEEMKVLLKEINGPAVGIEQIAAHIGYRGYTVMGFHGPLQNHTILGNSCSFAGYIDVFS
jgi:hypothetical protein